MQFFVHGVDNDGATEQLDLLAVTHWAYMDGYADRLVARGPTLSPDGEHHTGSVHILAADSAEDAHRFAFGEPYWRAGVYASVTVARFHNAMAGTMWDRPRPPRGSTSSLIVVTWGPQPFTPAAHGDAQMLARLAETELLVFGGLLVSDDAASSSGMAAALDADAELAAALVAHIGLPEPITAYRWQRGGRDQE
jgi:uncharacterized protein YciI